MPRLGRCAVCAPLLEPAWLVWGLSEAAREEGGRADNATLHDAAPGPSGVTEESWRARAQRPRLPWETGGWGLQVPTVPLGLTAPPLVPPLPRETPSPLGNHLCVNLSVNFWGTPNRGRPQGTPVPQPTLHTVPQSPVSGGPRLARGEQR